MLFLIWEVPIEYVHSQIAKTHHASNGIRNVATYIVICKIPALTMIIVPVSHHKQESFQTNQALYKESTLQGSEIGWKLIWNRIMNVVAAHIPEDNKLQKFNFIVIVGPLNCPIPLKEQALTSSLTR